MIVQAAALAVGSGIGVAIAVSGGDPIWAWVLTLGQCGSMPACAADRPGGWAVVLAMQPGWAVYGVLSGQAAFAVTALVGGIAGARALRRLVLPALRSEAR